MEQLTDTNSDTAPNGIKVSPSPGLTTKPQGLDLSEFTADPYQMNITLEKRITRVPVVKTIKQKFFKTHPTMELCVPAVVLKEEDETYLVSKALVNDIQTELTWLTLYVCHMQNGSIFIVKVTMPDKEGKWNSWHKSLSEIVIQARDNWIRVESDKSVGGYVAMVASASYLEPEWPDLDLPQIIEIAFKDKIIRDLDHPILRQLRGEV